MSQLTGRSVHTIRLRCPVADYKDGKALYDIDICQGILGAIPTRRRRESAAAA